jgi:hypothetical protein
MLNFATDNIHLVLTGQIIIAKDKVNRRLQNLQRPIARLANE